VVPKDEAAEVLSKARDSAAKEEQLRGRLAKGEYIYDVLQLEETLKSLGVVEDEGGADTGKG